MKGEPIRRVSSFKPEGCTIGRVKDLLNQDKAGWNDNQLHQLFNEEDVQAIKKTPISMMGLSDKMVWTFANDRQYSVKTRYKLAKECEKQAKGNESTSTKARRKRLCGEGFGV